MNDLNYYRDIKYEINILENRLELISEYEQKLLNEKEMINATLCLQKKVLNQIEVNLKKLSGIESKLFAEIVINGTNVTKAIEKIAVEESKDISTLWKNYYPNVKEKINELKSLNFETKKRKELSHL
ncbi:MAG: hypothetical protein MR388_01660 [Tenericutes bacterium]|nr:hypothetical protein [Mycoplasmatota bacterium]